MTIPMLRSFVLICFVAGFVSGPRFPSMAIPQEQEKPQHEFLMDKIIGTWVMQGTIDDENVTHDVIIDRILNNQYVRIHEIAREKDANGDPAYEAWIHIAWDKHSEEFVVMWLDNTGVTNFAPEGVGHGKPDGDRIPFIWKLADGSGIHNTFAYERASNTWTWSIDNLDKSGKSSPFGRLTLKQK